MAQSNHRPGPLDSNVQSLYMLRSVEHAWRCVRRLASDGHTVLSVHVGSRNPRVVIERSARCARLHGAMAIRRQTPEGRELVMVAELEHCEVRWTEEAA